MVFHNVFVRHQIIDKKGVVYHATQPKDCCMVAASLDAIKAYQFAIGWEQFTYHYHKEGPQVAFDIY
jgi:hypothetical protein